MGEEVQPIYVDLASEIDDPKVTVISSLCMMCHEMVSVSTVVSPLPLVSFSR